MADRGMAWPVNGLFARMRGKNHRRHCAVRHQLMSCVSVIAHRRHRRNALSGMPFYLLLARHHLDTLLSLSVFIIIAKSFSTAAPM